MVLVSKLFLTSVYFIFDLCLQTTIDQSLYWSFSFRDRKKGPKSFLNVGRRHRQCHLKALLGAVGGVERSTALPRAISTPMRSAWAMALVGHHREVLLHWWRPRPATHFHCRAAQLSLYLQECEDLLLITSFMLSAPESSSSSVKRPARGAPGRPWNRISVKYGTQKCENIPWQEHMFARGYVCKKHEMHDTG